jgi:hypothetical protein
MLIMLLKVLEKLGQAAARAGRLDDGAAHRNEVTRRVDGPEPTADLTPFGRTA